MEKKRDSEGNLRFHDKEVSKQIWALGKTCNRNRGRKKILTAGETTKKTPDAATACSAQTLLVYISKFYL